MSDLTMSTLVRYGAMRHATRTVRTVRGDTVVELGYAELFARAERLAGVLHAHGVRRGDVVITLCRNHHEHLELLFASHLLGTCFTPLNTRVDDASLRTTFATTPPRVVVTDADGTGRLAGDLVPGDALRVSVGDAPGWTSYDELLASSADALDALEPVGEDDLAAVLFTGGTTGEPKGATYTQRALYLHTISYSSAVSCPIHPSEVLLALVPVCHGLSWQTLQVGWLMGADLVLVDGSLPSERVLAAVRATGATFAAAVPTVWQDAVQYAQQQGAADLGTLRTVLIGGAMVPDSLPEALAALGVETHVGWGMTETLPATLSLIASPDPDAPVEPDPRISRPFPGVSVEARTAHRDEKVGVLHIRAPWVTGHYLGMEEPPDEWFDTGDLGRVLPTGQFEIVGRAKEMIKSGGEQIWPGVIEEALVRLPEVVDAAVIEIPHERWGGQPLAVVELAVEVSTDHLRDRLLEVLPRWQVPTAYVRVDALPRTVLGKTDKRLLGTRFRAGELGAPSSGTDPSSDERSAQ